MVESDMLDAWQEKYIPEGKGILTIKFEGYTELAYDDGFRMGYCRVTWNLGATLYGLQYMNGSIWLDDDHTKCPSFFRDAVLWHEFCHVWDAFTEIHVDHCSKFQRKKWKKPLYALGDVVLKLIGWVWFD